MDNYIPSPESQAVLSRIQDLCGINPKIWKDLTDAGIFKECSSYKDYFTTLVSHYRYNKEAKEIAAKAKLAEAENKPRFKNSELRDQLDQVTIAEKIQKIRLDKAKEQELWVKNQVSRGELVSKGELEQLMFPTFVTICNILRHAADETPELQQPIDKCLAELFSLGERLEENAIGDSKKYVEIMLATEVDYMELIEGFEG